MRNELLLGMTRTIFVASAVCAAAGAFAVACSGEDANTRKGSGVGSGGDFAGGNGGSSGSGPGGNGGSGVSNGGSAGAGFTFSDASFRDVLPEACASSTYEGEPSPLDIYIMFDQSGSMNETPGGRMGGGGGGGMSKWDSIKGALNTFMMDPQSSGIGLGIQYFPLGLSGAQACTNLSCVIPCSQPMNLPQDCQCLNIFIGYACASTAQGSCNAMDYQPPDVPIAPLPGVASAMMTSLNNHGPGGLTPTEPAVQGALAYASMWAQQNQTHKTIFVLATDGDPTGCDMNTNTPPSIASNVIAPAFAAQPSIKTFVIGVGSSLTSLNQMAMAGGTDQALIVDTTQDAGAQFLAAMRKIRGSSLACNFAVPSAGDASSIDYSRVNVQFTADGQQTLVGYADSAADCDPQQGGWYYNDQKTQVYLCPASCDQASIAVTVKLDILLGCDQVRVHPK